MAAILLRFLLKPWWQLVRKDFRIELSLRRLISKHSDGQYGRVWLDSQEFYFHDAATFVNQYREIFFKQVYGVSLTEKQPVIIDAGANMGLAIRYWKRFYPDAIVVGIEPDEKIFEVLKRNTSSFGTEVELIHGMLVDRQDNSFFLPDGKQGGRRAYKGVKVHGVLLSEILREQARVSLLKLDIEGSEWAVLDEAREELHRVQHLFIEYHSFEGEPEHLTEILQLLHVGGFNYKISGETWNKPFVNSFPDIGLRYTLNIYASRF